MSQPLQVSDLLASIIVLSLIIFAAWAAIWGTPNLRLFAGIALLATFLPVIITRIIQGTTTPMHGIIFASGVLLIVSKFIV